MIREMEVRGDLEAMKSVVESIYPLFAARSQIGVTARPDHPEPLYDAVGWLPEDSLEADYSMITEPFRGTVIERILENLPFAYGRTRLMLMRPKSCLSMHADPTRRYHFAITTNPGCYMAGMNGAIGTIHHIPADGMLYELDAHLTHTAMNSGDTDRVHLVICPADPARPTDSMPVGRIMTGQPDL
ncbi:MAG: aspartyl/asparaginyl beta-hydroxylase domain-containing protein [Rhodospirillales bacterium]|nr:aspartyl/asparaginyl beta-hydroxylase domain-containing protein [Rhodospirillales bacterium]